MCSRRRSSAACSSTRAEGAAERGHQPGVRLETLVAGPGLALDPVDLDRLVHEPDDEEVPAQLPVVVRRVDLLDLVAELGEQLGGVLDRADRLRVRARAARSGSV